jgi:hypothetical protein
VFARRFSLVGKKLYIKKTEDRVPPVALHDLDFKGAAGFFNLLFGRGTCLVNRDLQRFAELTLSKHLYLVDLAFHETLFTKSHFIDLVSGLEIVLELGNVDSRDGVAELQVAEATLGKATSQRHLTTFESRANTTTGTRLLTLVTPSGGLTKARTFSATKTLTAMLGSGIRLKIMEIHWNEVSLELNAGKKD